MRLKSTKWPGRQGQGCASLLLAGAFMMSAPQALAQRVFLEDFEGLALGPNQEEALLGDHVWTKTPPAGWTIDDSKMPGVGDASQNGITEWAGWSFANKTWWMTTAGDQRRTEFVFGTGTVMIADPDEWDDAAHAKGLFDSTIKTKAISLAGAAANTLVLFYDSSWRPEATDDGLPNFPVNDEGTPINNQTGYIKAQFDSGSTNEVQRWTSINDESTYHGHFPNESVLIELNNPAGAQNVTLTFGMDMSANDWWWAVDNIAIGAPPFGVGIVADGVSFRARIVEALGITVDQAKPIIVELDGVAITGAQFVREEPLFLVDYTQAPTIFQPGTTHTVKVKYTSSANKAMEDTFTFVAPGYTTATATPVTVTATITDAPWLTVDETKPIALELDGAAVTGATVARSGSSVIARFVRATPFVPESSHNLKVTFVTTDGATVVDPVTFTAPKVTVIPAALATAVGTGLNPGLNWRTHQLDAARGTSVALAEQQLAGALGESVHDTSLQEADGFFHIDFVNFDQNAGEAGNFSASAAEPQNVEDGFIPGIPGVGTDNIAAEALAFVEIPAAGIYTMVVNSDDGFRVSVGTTNSPVMVELGKYDGGRGQADSQFYFQAESAGVYFVRLLYFEGGSDARVEWFTVNTEGSRALVNGTQPGALKTFRARSVAEPIISNRVFFEDFEGLTLGHSVEEGLVADKVWTATPPAGWSVDRSKVPGVGDSSTDGITEWAGWSFADKTWWMTTAGDQRRTEYVYGFGTVMIADPDEWDDADHTQGLLETTVKTRAISVAGAPTNGLVLYYDSSWRPEAKDDGLDSFPVDAEGNPINDQTGFILAQFDNGSTNELQRWTSVSEDATYHGHFPNEAVVIPLNNPPGSQNVVLTFGMEKAANDWWWAVDNIAIGAPPFGVGITADGVSFRARILEMAGATVDQTKGVVVQLDGVTVTGAQLVAEEPFLYVDYSQSPTVFAPKSVHTVKVSYTSSGNKALADTFTFVAPSYTSASATPTSVTAVITDAAWLTVDETKPIGLELDGAAVAGATVARVDASVVVRFNVATPFAPLSSHNLKVTFVTSLGATVVDPVTFTTPNVVEIPATLATALGTGAQPGLKWRTHQLATARGTSVALAEQQLAGTLGASVHDATLQEADGFFLVDFVNFDQNAGEAGNFRTSAPEPQNVDDGFIPGIPGEGTDNIAAEGLAFVEIPAAGIYSMVVNSDDGFRVTVGTTNSPVQVELGKYDGGRGQADSQFYFHATRAGVYYFRLLYFEGGSDARVEWFTVNADGSRALVNGTQPGALKAYRVRTVPEPGSTPTNNITSIARQGGSVVITYTGVLKSASEAAGPYTVVTGATSPATITATGTRQFFIAQ